MQSSALYRIGDKVHFRGAEGFVMQVEPSVARDTYIYSLWFPTERKSLNYNQGQIQFFVVNDLLKVERKKKTMSDIQKWNPETNTWENVSIPIWVVKLPSYPPNVWESSNYQPNLSECRRHNTGEKPFFKVGDMFEDNLDGPGWGIGMVIKTEKITEPMLYTMFDNEGNKKTDKYPINQWKYLIDFPASAKTSSPKGEIWCWEFPLREAIDDGWFIIHRKIAKK